MIAGSKVLALIPARGGSKGVPGKNILQIGGKALIQYTIDAVAGSRFVDRVVVSSDDPSIMAVATAAGCEAPFRRPSALATDEALAPDVVADALERLPGFDIVVLLQPTSPLRTARDIDDVLELLVATSAPACVTIRPAEEHPHWMFSLEDDGRIRPLVGLSSKIPLRRQDLPAVWCLNGAVYSARVDWFMRERTFLSAQTAGHPMPTERSLDIDTVDDVEHFRAMLENELPASG